MHGEGRVFGRRLEANLDASGIELISVKPSYFTQPPGRPHPNLKRLPTRHRTLLLELLPSIQKGFENRDLCALYHAIHREDPKRLAKWKSVFYLYGVPWKEPGSIRPYGFLDHRRGAEGIRCMLAHLKRLGPNFDSHRSVVSEVEDLKATCDKLQYLLWTDRSCPNLQDRVEKLLDNIRTSPALDLDHLEGVEDFTEAYLGFCALSLTSQDPDIPSSSSPSEDMMRELHQLADRELKKAIQRLETFDSLYAAYLEDGRQDIAAVMRQNEKAARKAGFRDGVSSVEESQQIYDELGKIESGLANIRQRLKDSKEFWERVDRDLKSAPHTPAGKKANEPPDGSKTESMAQKIQTGLETIYDTAQQYSGAPQILKTGTRIVRRASNLTKDCTTLSLTQASVESHLQNPTCNAKSCHKALAPLTKGLGSNAKSYAKLSKQYKEWAGWIYLLFWFAGTTTAEKLRMDRPDHVTHADLLANGFSSYLLPFESSLNAIRSHLRGIQKFWKCLEVMDAGILRPAL
ncbi:hypothetical protein FB451DRAFT_1205995 [Mycena latifolia]|nr:hypothetical protein FB451DRAFT_1205995 [Mycena latifolia]